MGFQLLIVTFGAFCVILPVVMAAFVYFQLPKRRKCDFRGKHALVTGGSKGIGKAIAVELLKHGCRCVTIVARNLDALMKASEELAAFCEDDQFVQYFLLDVSSGYEQVQSVVKMAEEAARSVMTTSSDENRVGCVDILINNVGTVVQGAFDEININAFEEQMRTNYLSLVYATRAVLEGMKLRKSGHLAFVSSAAGQCALWGYGAYAPSKFAIRGLADTLHMELLPYDIGVTVLCPPNTNTEGFQEELKGMPQEVREISHAAGLFSTSDVAEALLSRMSNGDYSAYVGLEGWMLSVLSAGAAPEPNFWAAFAQIMLGGLFRGVMLIYIGSFNSIVQRCHATRRLRTN